MFIIISNRTSLISAYCREIERPSLGGEKELSLKQVFNLQRLKILYLGQQLCRLVCNVLLKTILFNFLFSGLSLKAFPKTLLKNNEKKGTKSIWLAHRAISACSVPRDQMKMRKNTVGVLM